MEFKWDDPLLLDRQLGEDERMIRDAAQAYSQGKLLVRADPNLTRGAD